MKTLEQVRIEIDQVDQELITLILKRLELSKDVKAVKVISGKTVFDPNREREVIEQLQKLIPAEHHDYLETLYTLIFDYSKVVQNR